jgi:hypothetical protein
MPDAIVYEWKPRKAKREGVGAFVGLAGGTGSGKTYTALRMARGIAGPKGRILAGDTEGRRMSHYSDEFDFEVVDILAPFKAEKFESLIRYAEANAFDVVVIDSFSHEWNGDGGILEQHDAITQGNDKLNFKAWGDVKPAHKRMLQSFLQRRIPIIFCMRAEEKLKIVGNKPVPQGWQPICDPRFGYELTVLITLSNENPGKTDYKLPRKIPRHLLSVFPDGVEITEEAGAKIAAWARGDDLPKTDWPQPPEKPSTDKTTAIVDGLITRMAACETALAVESIFGEDLVKRQVTWMKTHRVDQHDRLMQAADERSIALRQPPDMPEDPPAEEQAPEP